MVALGLYLDRKPDKTFDLRIRGVVPEGGLQIHFRLRKQAWPQFAVGGESQPAALRTKMVAERTYEPDHAGGPFESEISCGA